MCEYSGCPVPIDLLNPPTPTHHSPGTPFCCKKYNAAIPLELSKGFTPENTDRNTKWTVTNFEDWAKEKNINSAFCYLLILKYLKLLWPSLFLKLERGKVSDNNKELWYTSVRNTPQKMVKQMCSSAGIVGNKTNHSLRTFQTRGTRKNCSGKNRPSIS